MGANKSGFEEVAMPEVPPKDEIPEARIPAQEELDLAALEKIARESVITRSFQGPPDLTPPPAPKRRKFSPQGDSQR